MVLKIIAIALASFSLGMILDDLLHKLQDRWK